MVSFAFYLVARVSWGEFLVRIMAAAAAHIEHSGECRDIGGGGWISQSSTERSSGQGWPAAVQGSRTHQSVKGTVAVTGS